MGPEMPPNDHVVGFQVQVGGRWSPFLGGLWVDLGFQSGGFSSPSWWILVPNLVDAE